MSLRRLGLLFALPTVVGISLSACGTEDDAAPGPAGGSGATAGAAGTGGTAGSGAIGGTGAEAGMNEPEGGSAGSTPTPSEGGSGGDTAPEGGAGGDGPSASAGDGNMAGAGGEGGQAAPMGCHLNIQYFNSDPAGAIGTYLTPDTGPVQSSTVQWSSTEGFTLAGAGKLNATFGAAGEQAQLSIYPSPGTWTCTTKAHARIKLVSTTDLSQINGVNFGISSGVSPDGRYAGQFTSTAGFLMDTWYAIELPFATAGYQSPASTLPDFTHVVSLGIQVQTKSTGTPVPVTLYVDDVWVE